MGKSPSIRFPAFARAWTVPFAAGIILLLFLAGATLLRWRSVGGGPHPKDLSPAAKERLREKARELAPFANLYFAYVEEEAATLAKIPGQDLDEERLLEFSRLVVSGSDALVGAFQREVDGISKAEGIERARVREHFSKEFRDLAGRTEVPFLRMIPRGGCTIGLRLLNAPRLLPQQGLGPEGAKERAIQHLLEVLSKLPPQSNGARGIREAIRALRRAILPFDTTPVAISFASPPEDSISSAIPPIAFEMTDSGSGPEPESRKLEAENTGPVITETRDLTAFARVILDDRVNGIVKVDAVDMPASAIKDGFINLRASGTDFAANPHAMATRSFVLDREPPAITVTSPADGGVSSAVEIILDASIALQTRSPASTRVRCRLS